MHISTLLAIAPPETNISVPGDGLDIVTSANALCDRLMDAVPGQVINYHVGFLARDRVKPVSHLPDAERIELSALAHYAMRMMEAGWLHLLQRRVGPEQFIYFAVVRARPRQARRIVPTPTARRLLAEVA